jgi:uncharacterized membrane protein
MTRATLLDILRLGTITGMRSMAGPAALSLRTSSSYKHVIPLLAVGEMMADKTSLVGDRIDPLPLGGRAVMGALVGGIVARDHGGSTIAGGLIGAMTAVLAAHLAYRIRTRMPVSTTVGGLMEDAVVVGLASAPAR